MSDLDKKLADLEKLVAAKEAAKRDAKSAAYQQRRIEFLEAKSAALETIEPEQLLEENVQNVGWVLFKWPDDNVYNEFMQTTGALKGDLSAMRFAHVDRLLGLCCVYPGKKVIEELREKNPGARTVIVDRLLGAMRKRLADEGK